MANLASLMAFAEAARRSSFAGAARELGLTASAVAKSIARLEADLGVRLFHRTTRKVALTGDGRTLFARCERIVSEMEALRDEAAGVRAEPGGTLRINVPITVGKRLVVPALARMVRKHPSIAVEAFFTDRYADLAGEGLDAAVRIGPLRDSALIARPIGRQRMIVCAAPAYLARHGTPRTPAGLEGHACLAFRIPSSGRLWTWHFSVGGKVVEWEPRSGIAMDDGEALVAAAAAGMGLIHVPDYMAADVMARRKVVEVLGRYRPPDVPISVVYLSARRVPPRVRAFLEAFGGSE